MKKIILVLFACALLILGFIGVSNKKKDNNLKEITIAEVTHSAFYAPFYVSIHNGYFEEKGISVNLILTSGADKVASAVLSGDAEIGLSGLEATVYVYQNNASDYLVNFSSLTKRDGQFLIGDCKLQDSFNLSDLYGKKVLAGRNAGMPLMVFKYALYKNNIDINKVTIDSSVDFASLTGAYIGGNGDFVNLFEPTATKIETEGYGCVLESLGQLSGELPYTVFHTKKSYYENNKDIINGIRDAINKGLNFVKNNDSTVIANIIKDEFPDTSINELSEVIDRYKKADSWWDNYHINREAYDNLMDLMIYNKAISDSPKYEDIVMND